MPTSKLKKIPASECTVRFYSGYKGYEIPRALILKEKEYPIDKILSTERTRNTDTEETLDIFICLTGRKKLKIIVKESNIYDVYLLDDRKD